MNRYLVLFTIILTSHIYAQWIEKKNGLPETWIHGHAIDASDSLCAVISIPTNSIPFGIFITKNGGEEWMDISPPITDVREQARDISIIDENHIWLATTGKYITRILATNDGGENWSTQFFDTTKTQYFNYIEMFDIINGIAMGDAIFPSEAAVILQTDNGGLPGFQ